MNKRALAKALLKIAERIVEAKNWADYGPLSKDDKEAFVKIVQAVVSQNMVCTAQQFKRVAVNDLGSSEARAKKLLKTFGDDGIRAVKEQLRSYKEWQNAWHVDDEKYRAKLKKLEADIKSLKSAWDARNNEFMGLHDEQAQADYAKAVQAL